MNETGRFEADGRDVIWHSLKHLALDRYTCTAVTEQDARRIAAALNFLSAYNTEAIASGQLVVHEKLTQS